MTYEDLYGCDVTLSDEAARNAWNKTVKGFLAHSAATANHLSDTINLSPNFALGHAARGLFTLLLCRKELIPIAQEALTTAKDIAQQGHISEREAYYIKALEQWLEGRPSQSVLTVETLLKRWPHDAMAMKLSHAIQFILGDINGMHRSIENLFPAYTDGHAAYGYFMGCYAFCLEETGDYKRAEIFGRRGLEFSSDDAWGLHAVAHVYDMTGNAKDGVKWLDGREKSWEHCNNFRYHVWWHLALMYLDLGNIDRVLDLYDTEIRNDKTDDYRDISNATSLLIRLELEGVDVGNRWEELANICESRVDDTTLAFADLHYMLALCGGDKQQAASELIHNMEYRDSETCDLGRVIVDPGLAAAKGLEAFREGEYEKSFSYLSKARLNMQQIGGSHAQRDVFERITIEAAIKAGLPRQARVILQDREKRRGFQDGYSAKRLAIVEQLCNNNMGGTDQILA